jgi:hypothetical protein
VSSIGCEVQVGTLHDVAEAFWFDTIIYIDVLEHIENDRAELVRAAGFLRAGGHLVVLAPAHQWLFSPFDAAIGHYRRYTRRTLAQLAPPELTLIRLDHLDAVGVLLSLGNRSGLRQRMPGADAGVVVGPHRCSDLQDSGPDASLPCWQVGARRLAARVTRSNA